MMSKLKMWIGNLDGTRQGLVIATSAERARKIVGTGKKDFQGYWVVQPDVHPLLLPETLYTRPFQETRYRKDVPWHVGRCVILPKEKGPEEP